MIFQLVRFLQKLGGDQSDLLPFRRSGGVKHSARSSVDQAQLNGGGHGVLGVIGDLMGIAEFKPCSFSRCGGFLAQGPNEKNRHVLARKVLSQSELPVARTFD
ncbi:hypothetical protein D1872_276340 [compost metagenome]